MVFIQKKQKSTIYIHKITKTTIFISNLKFPTYKSTSKIGLQSTIYNLEWLKKLYTIYNYFALLVYNLHSIFWPNLKSTNPPPHVKLTRLELPWYQIINKNSFRALVLHILASWIFRVARPSPHLTLFVSSSVCLSYPKQTSDNRGYFCLSPTLYFIWYTSLPSFIERGGGRTHVRYYILYYREGGTDII